MTDKMKNLWVRAVSGVVLLAIVLGTILWSKWSFGALLLMIILGGEWEFYRMAEKAGYSPQKTLGLVAGAIVMTVAFALMWFFDTESTLSNKYLVLTVGLMLYIMMLVPLMFICELYRKSATPIANIGSTLTGVVYVALPMSLLFFIPLLLGHGVWNPWTPEASPATGVWLVLVCVRRDTASASTVSRGELLFLFHSPTPLTIIKIIMPNTARNPSPTSTSRPPKKKPMPIACAPFSR